MTHPHEKDLKWHKIDPAFYTAWTKQALKPNSPYKPLFSRLDKAYRQKEILDARVELFICLHYTKPRIKTRVRKVWGARIKQVQMRVNAGRLAIFQACKRDQAQSLAGNSSKRGGR
jgi:hypothetical protein